MRWRKANPVRPDRRAGKAKLEPLAPKAQTVEKAKPDQPALRGQAELPAPKAREARSK